MKIIKIVKLGGIILGIIFLPIFLLSDEAAGERNKQHYLAISQENQETKKQLINVGSSDFRKLVERWSEEHNKHYK